jgi:Uma2 family endonuclease
MSNEIMVTTIPTRTATLDGDQCVEMRGLDWKGYSTMLRLRGERSVPRMIYLDGSVFLMSPSLRHEDLKKLLGIFVSEIALGLDIFCRQTGQTTFRRRKKEGGVEGDETYYVANAARVRGKKEIDLRTDPPPDLAVEVVYTHAAAAAIEVYRRLGVHEVWICDANGLHIQVLRDDGHYAEDPASAAFPFLTAEEIFSWVGRPDAEANTEWHKDLRRWVRDVLVPRAAGPK